MGLAVQKKLVLSNAFANYLYIFLTNKSRPEIHIYGIFLPGRFLSESNCHLIMIQYGLNPETRVLQQDFDQVEIPDRMIVSLPNCSEPVSIF